MSAVYEGRLSDSPYIEIIWRGHTVADHSPVCPADVRWNLLFMKYQNQVRVSAEGATTQHVPKNQFEGSEFLVIKFKLGVFMPYIPPTNILNGDLVLPAAARQSTFWLKSSTWQMPSFENAEVFVDWLVKDGVLVTDPVVGAALQDHPMDISARTIRRRFLQSTGLTPKVIQQIERAQQASALLVQGVSILDVVYQLGYADQPHMTRSLKRFIGATPAEILHANQPTTP